MATLSQIKYRIILIESEEGWAVWCDDLPGCCSQGGTREEAVENTRIAIAEYLDAQPEIGARFGTRIFHEEIAVLRETAMAWNILGKRPSCGSSTPILTAPAAELASGCVKSKSRKGAKRGGFHGGNFAALRGTHPGALKRGRFTDPGFHKAGKLYVDKFDALEK